ncbi:alpha/beta hydrolase [Dermabacteraceae bacterium P13095]
MTLWQDRKGNQYRETQRRAPHTDSKHRRIVGSHEHAWKNASPQERENLRADYARLGMPLTTSPDADGNSEYTWFLFEAAGEEAVLWVNGLFSADDIADFSFAPVDDAGTLALTLRQKADWVSSYRIARHAGSAPAPWRSAAPGRPTVLALLKAGKPDPLCKLTSSGSMGEVSLLRGPSAPETPWQHTLTAGDADSPRGSVTALPDTEKGERAWVYSPPGNATNTPLLVLFDGQVWHEKLNLAAQLDHAINAGKIAPLHVLMLDSGDQEHRTNHLGVPGGQVETVIDALLPHVRANWPVSPLGSDTIVSGQSFGGIASLWTLALADGQVRHALAQSPSLWRFRLADALVRALGDWDTLALSAGHFEGNQLEMAEELSAELLAENADLTITLTPITGGHDWAWWREELLRYLARWSRARGAV